jgi:hypothetical protein
VAPKKTQLATLQFTGEDLLAARDHAARVLMLLNYELGGATTFFSNQKSPSFGVIEVAQEELRDALRRLHHVMLQDEPGFEKEEVSP